MRKEWSTKWMRRAVREERGDEDRMRKGMGKSCAAAAIVLGAEVSKSKFR